jgi:hypothetical protein
MTATRTNAEKYKMIRNRIRELVENHGPDVQENMNRYIGMGVFAEVAWVLNMADRLMKNDPKKLNDFEPEPEEDAELS